MGRGKNRIEGKRRVRENQVKVLLLSGEAEKRTKLKMKADNDREHQQKSMEWV